MKDFLDNISRYPRFFITICLGVFFAFFEWLRPLIKNRIAVIAFVSILVAGFAFLFFTLRAMLGLTAV